MSKPNRAVYIGGFSNGKWAADQVARALEPHYLDIDTFTFAAAMDDPETIRRAVQGIDVLTHSAGMLALPGTRPRSIEAFAAPLPTSKWALVGRTFVKAARMHTFGIGIHRPADIPVVLGYDASVSGEMLAHPRGNLGRLGQIANFNCVKTAINAQDADIPTRLVHMEGDEYFRFGPDDEVQATVAGAAVRGIPGVHDELVLRPSETFQAANADAWASGRLF